METGTSDYTYEPLSAQKQQFRLVRLTSEQSTINSCEIFIFEVETAPPYIALSYTWDLETAPKQRITLNHQTFEIGETVQGFFTAFQDPPDATRGTWLWIDQACIDQANVFEKNIQVPLMSKIYSRCQYAVAWLVSAALTTREIPFHRYFTRMWIVQEFLLPPKTYILCQDKWYPWQTWGLEHATTLSETKMCELIIFRSGNYICEVTDPGPQKLLIFVRMFGEQGCRDPRDKIYGLLGLAFDPRLVPVDYGKSVTPVYVDALEAFGQMEAMAGEREMPGFDWPWSLTNALDFACIPSAKQMGIDMDKMSELRRRCSVITRNKATPDQAFFQRLVRPLDNTETEDDLKHHVSAAASERLPPIARYNEDSIKIVDMGDENGSLSAEFDIYR